MYANDVPIISFILPCYNEVGSIGYLIQQSIALGWTEYNSEFIIVDDGSTDGTIELLELMSSSFKSIKIIKTDNRLGLAGSIRIGIENSIGTYCLVMDTDGMHDPAYVSKFLRETDAGVQLVIGSRYISGGIMLGGLYPTLSRIINLLIKKITRSRVNDQLCGYFLAPRLTLLEVPVVDFVGFGEYFIKLVNFFERQRLLITEIPTIHRVRTSGKRKSVRRKMLVKYIGTAWKLR